MLNALFSQSTDVIIADFQKVVNKLKNRTQHLGTVKELKNKLKEDLDREIAAHSAEIEKATKIVANLENLFKV